MSSHKATLLPGGSVIEVQAGETILDAALRQGEDLTYSCRNGTCRSCIHQVVEGNVVQEDEEFCMISPQELEAGRRLICMSVLRGDAVLEKLKPSGRLKPKEEK